MLHHSHRSQTKWKENKIKIYSYDVHVPSIQFKLNMLYSLINDYYVGASESIAILIPEWHIFVFKKSFISYIYTDNTFKCSKI